MKTWGYQLFTKYSVTALRWNTDWQLRNLKFSSNAKDENTLQAELLYADSFIKRNFSFKIRWLTFQRIVNQFDWHLH